MSGKLEQITRYANDQICKYLKVDMHEELVGKVVAVEGVQFKYYSYGGWKFKVNHRLTGPSGRCDAYYKYIEIAPHHLAESPIDEIQNTILHEIAHAVLHEYHICNERSHGKLWHKIALAIGCDGEVYDSRQYKTKKQRQKYDYLCIECYESWTTKIRTVKNHRCAYCHTPIQASGYSEHYGHSDIDG